MQSINAFYILLYREFGSDAPSIFFVKLGHKISVSMNCKEYLEKVGKSRFMVFSYNELMQK